MVNTKRILPVMNLTQPEKKWLNLVYQKLINQEKIDYREIRIKLYKEIPKSFNPNQISSLLIDGKGERITLLGIYCIDPKTPFIEKANLIINQIRKNISEDFRLQSIKSSTISEQLKLEEEEVGIILSMISRYGRFIQGASISQKYNGYDSIDLGESYEVFNQYMYFKSIEELIIEDFQKGNSEKKKYNIRKRGIGDLEKENNDIVLARESIFHSKIPPVDLKLCFVLMPFHKEWSERVYKDYIRENIENMGLQCLRADNLKGPIIIEDIWVKINQAAFIIADVTDMNPNVMYELGIVHTIGKPTILITQDINNIPFDFKHLRHYPYKDNIDGFKEFGKEIKENVLALYKEHYPDIVLER